MVYSRASLDAVLRRHGATLEAFEIIHDVHGYKPLFRAAAKVAVIILQRLRRGGAQLLIRATGLVAQLFCRALPAEEHSSSFQFDPGGGGDEASGASLAAAELFVACLHFLRAIPRVGTPDRLCCSVCGRAST